MAVALPSRPDLQGSQGVLQAILATLNTISTKLTALDTISTSHGSFQLKDKLAIVCPVRNDDMQPVLLYNIVDPLDAQRSTTWTLIDGAKAANMYVRQPVTNLHTCLATFMNDDDEKELCVSGPPGCGKTLALLAFVNSEMMQDKACAYIRQVSNKLFIALVERRNKETRNVVTYTATLAGTGNPASVLSRLERSLEGTKLRDMDLIVADGVRHVGKHTDFPLVSAVRSLAGDKTKLVFASSVGARPVPVTCYAKEFTMPSWSRTEIIAFLSLPAGKDTVCRMRELEKVPPFAPVEAAAAPADAMPPAADAAMVDPAPAPTTTAANLTKKRRSARKLQGQGGAQEGEAEAKVPALDAPATESAVPQHLYFDETTVTQSQVKKLAQFGADAEFVAAKLDVCTSTRMLFNMSLEEGKDLIRQEINSLESARLEDMPLPGNPSASNFLIGSDGVPTSPYVRRCLLANVSDSLFAKFVQLAKRHANKPMEGFLFEIAFIHGISAQGRIALDCRELATSQKPSVNASAVAHVDLAGGSARFDGAGPTSPVPSAQFYMPATSNHGGFDVAHVKKTNNLKSKITLHFTFLQFTIAHSHSLKYRFMKAFVVEVLKKFLNCSGDLLLESLVNQKGELTDKANDRSVKISIDVIGVVPPTETESFFWSSVDKLPPGGFCRVMVGSKRMP